MSSSGASVVRAVWLTAVWLGLCAGCKGEPAGTDTGGGPTQAATAASLAATSTTAVPTANQPSANNEPKPPWFVGSWSGQYQAERLNPLEGKNYGQQMAWIRDQGKRFVGPGTLTLTIDAQGLVEGTASGALGEATLRGRIDEQNVALTLRPKQDAPEAFSGTLTGTKPGAELQLTLRAASGDGKWIRGGSATLTQDSPGPQQTP